MLKIIKSFFALSEWKKILIGLVLGGITGLIIGKHALIFQPIGNIFINAIHMMIVPVISVAIVCAVLSMKDLNKMWKVFLGAMIVYLICMTLSTIIGISVANIFEPGFGAHPMLAMTSHVAHHQLSFSSVLENIVPSNPVQAFSDSNVLQIVVFSLIVGFSIKLAGEPAKPVEHFFQSLSHVVFKLADIVMWFAPYGIFALIAVTTGSYGVKTFLPLIKFISAVYAGCLLQVILVYCLGLLIFVKMNPSKFFKGIQSALLFAFSTASSAATLPESMRCTEENLGVSEGVSRFLLPLGSNFNLNGLAIYLSVATIFAANLYGIHLTMSQYITLAITVILTTMGAGAVPGSALIVMGAIMGSVNIPLGAIALIAGVDRINDMMQTATNVAADVFATTVVAKYSNELSSGSLIEESGELELECSSE